jgi:hypothetical protein
MARTAAPSASTAGPEVLGCDRSGSSRWTATTNLVQLSGQTALRAGGIPPCALRAEVHNEDVFIHLARHEKDFWAMLSACPILGDDNRLRAP